MSYKLLAIDYDKSIFINAFESGKYKTVFTSEDGFIDFASILDKELKQYVKELLNLPMQVECMFFINPPLSDCMTHIDDVRTCAINFPVNVPGEMYIAKEKNNEYFVKNKVGNNFPMVDSTTSYLYDRVVVDSYPIIFDPTVPHGAKNLTKDIRYIVSCSILDYSYNDVLEIFEQRGQVINTL